MAGIDILSAPTKPCHNCRRLRRRCDRSYPHCHKCTAAGQDCLGYGKLYHWTDCFASPATANSRVASVTYESALHPATASDDSQSAEDSQLLVVCSQRSVPAVESETLPSSPGALVDPLFQDVEYLYRHYLSYFATRVCKDLVSHDLPDRNPFRSLVPLTKTYPLLQHIVVAASAAHMSNLARAVSAPSDPAGDASARRALTDALVAKHKALRLLHDALGDIGSIGGDVVLAAVLFFINIELIEGGKHDWRTHLEGAGQIMTFLKPVGAGNEVLRDYILSDCFIYYILASAFMPSAPTAKLHFPSAHISSILGRAANSYLCCPPEILQILQAASQLSNRKTDDLESAAVVAQLGAQLMERAQTYDVHAWAYDVWSIQYFHSIPLKSRIHAGSAHRLATCLYILQAIPSASILVSTDLEELGSEIFYHLSCIPDEDPNFKATTWPTFIAGASATDMARRAWVLDRLQRLTVNCPWGFIKTAMNTLQVIWNLEDSVDPETQVVQSWVQMLKGPDLNFLMV